MEHLLRLQQLCQQAGPQREQQQNAGMTTFVNQQSDVH